MTQHRFASRPGDPRTIFVGTWLNKTEHAIYLERFEASGAENQSQFQRAALLTGAQIYVRDERADMDAVLRLTGAIQQAPSSDLQIIALSEALETLKRIAR